MKFGHFFVISHPIGLFNLIVYYYNVQRMQSKKDLSPIIIEAISDKKGKKIAVIDLSDIEAASTGKLIICQGNSTSQVSAIADSVREALLDKERVKPYNYEGYRNSQWIVIDYGDIMVHVFLPEFRQFYNLEGLWNDAPIEYLPDID